MHLSHLEAVYVPGHGDRIYGVIHNQRGDVVATTVPHPITCEGSTQQQGETLARELRRQQVHDSVAVRELAIRDFFVMRRNERVAARGYMSPQDKEQGFYSPIAQRYV